MAAEEAGLKLAKGKNLLGELGCLVLQTQMEEHAAFSHIAATMGRPSQGFSLMQINAQVQSTA